MKRHIILNIVFSSAGLIAGTIFGVKVANKRNKDKTKYCGTLRIDNSEIDEAPQMFLEVTDMVALNSCETAIFKINKENYYNGEN